MQLTPVHEYVWTDDLSFMRTLTCRNHTTARYLTKNPFIRSLHLVRIPDGDIERSYTGECKCAFSDLVVIEPV